MKKIIFFAAGIILSTSTYAGTKYYTQSEMKEDVSLLATSSYLYKNGADTKLYKNTQKLCRGVKYKYDNTSESVKTSDMRRWITKINSICSDY